MASRRVAGRATRRCAAGACGAAAAAGAALLVAPSPALAHGIVQRSDLPVPEWLFAWAAAIVLVASFAGLAVLWPRPKLQDPRWRSLGAPSRVLTSLPLEVLAGAVGLALLALAIWAGLWGEPGAQDNIAPTLVYVLFWVGLVFASLFFGDVFRLLSPWRAGGRAAGWVLLRLGGRAPAHRAYPQRLGRWPAAAALLFFTWTELVGGYGELPERIAIYALAYSAITWAAMALYGTETWHERGEGFAVYFNLFARLSIFERRGREVGVRPPLGGLPRLDPLPGTVAVVVVMIGTVTFDGLSQGPVWTETLGPALHDAFTGIGFGIESATTLANTVGLLLGPLLIGGFYAFGISGAVTVGGGFDTTRLRRTFVHTLVPIALVYVLAHYLTQLVFQGQAIGYLASDPLGHGWDLFGTAAAAIDYSVLGQTATWYLQAGFVIAGHVSGLVLAHDRALALYRDPQQAVRSQFWMLGVMVGFTSLALWLLASLNR